MNDYLVYFLNYTNCSAFKTKAEQRPVYLITDRVWFASKLVDKSKCMLIESSAKSKSKVLLVRRNVELLINDLQIGQEFKHLGTLIDHLLGTRKNVENVAYKIYSKS